MNTATLNTEPLNGPPLAAAPPATLPVDVLDAIRQRYFAEGCDDLGGPIYLAIGSRRRAVPYVVVEVVSAPLVFTSSTTKLRKTRFRFKCYQTDPDLALPAADALEAAFDGAGLQFDDGFTGPFVPGDRGPRKDVGLSNPGSEVWYELVEFTALVTANGNVDHVPGGASNLTQNWTDVTVSWNGTTLAIPEVTDVEVDKHSVIEAFYGDSDAFTPVLRTPKKVRQITIKGAALNVLVLIPEDVPCVVRGILNDLTNGTGSGAINLVASNCLLASNPFKGRNNELGTGTAKFQAYSVGGVDPFAISVTP